jgi:hypothetical protein
MRGRPSTRPGRWRPTYSAAHARVIEGELAGAPHNSEPAFLSRLSHHLAWYLARRFLLQHPVLAAQLGLVAMKEAARFTIADKLEHRAKRRDDNP